MPDYSAVPYPRTSVPDAEIQRVADAMRAKPEYYDVQYVADRYRSFGLIVLPDPFSKDVIMPIVGALENGLPFSVIRLGDGETDILTLDAYAGTANLDRHAFAVTAAKHFVPAISEASMQALSRGLRAAVEAADMVGVLGLWRARPAILEESVAGLFRHPRGPLGQWRGMDYLLALADTGVLQGKVVASAHLYFSMLEHLDRLVAAAQDILCLTSEGDAVDLLRQRYPEKRIAHHVVGDDKEGKVDPDGLPVFMRSVQAALRDDLSGHLCLIGAGPWAEIYCTWIKQRGGVAVDMGSAFDLIAGRKRRLVQRNLAEDGVDLTLLWRSDSRS